MRMTVRRWDGNEVVNLVAGVTRGILKQSSAISARRNGNNNLIEANWVRDARADAL